MTLRATLFALTLALAACGDTTSTDAGSDLRDAAAEAALDVAQDATLDVGSDAPRDQMPDREPFCDIPAVYTFGLDGGLTPVRDEYRIEPGRRFTATRVTAPGFDAGAGVCTTMIDYCGTSDGGTVDTLAVIVALNDADVMAAFADQTATLYGRDTRPVDGQVFFVRRGDGRHFEIGSDCGGAAMCRAVPSGLTRLRAVLERLAAQELARSTCAAR